MEHLKNSWLTRERAFAAFATGPLLDFWKQREEGEFTGVENVPIRYVRFISPQHDKVILLCPGRIESYVKYPELAYDLFHSGYVLVFIVYCAPFADFNVGFLLIRRSAVFWCFFIISSIIDCNPAISAMSVLIRRVATIVIVYALKALSTFFCVVLRFCLVFLFVVLRVASSRPFQDIQRHQSADAMGAFAAPQTLPLSGAADLFRR